MFLAFDIEGLNLFSRPGCFAKKFKAGRDTRIIGEASDINVLAKLIPATVIDQPGQQCFQCYSVKRVWSSWCGHLLVPWLDGLS